MTATAKVFKGLVQDLLVNRESAAAKFSAIRLEIKNAAPWAR
jgi:hypothetical protein